MAPRSTVKRIFAALSAFDAADSPMSRLDAARRLREAAEELETAQVEAARKAGATWLEIGARYGLTKQGAQQRFRAARKQAEADGAAANGNAPADSNAEARSNAAGPSKAAGPSNAKAHSNAAGPSKAAAHSRVAGQSKAGQSKKAEPAA